MAEEVKVREIYAMSPSQMPDWKEICRAFADKIDAELLWVNETSCGVQYKDGSFGHILIEDMMEYLQNEGKDNAEIDK